MNLAHQTKQGTTSSAVRKENGVPFFQAKLSINQPADIYEQEADAVADKVMRMPANGHPFFSPKPHFISSVQRKCKECEEEERQLQRKENSSEATVADTATENYISSLNSKGHSLTQGERSFFEPRFGYDLSDVQLHTNEEANKSAKNVNALAYTHGNNIVFAANQYQPNTDAGQRLMAHELTHVVQQNTNISRKLVQCKTSEEDIGEIIEYDPQDDYEFKVSWAQAMSFGHAQIAILITGEFLDVYELSNKSNLRSFQIHLNVQRVWDFFDAIGYMETFLVNLPFAAFGFDTTTFNIKPSLYEHKDHSPFTTKELNEDYFNVAGWFSSSEDQSEFQNLVKGKNALVLISKGPVIKVPAKTTEPKPQLWMETLNKDVKPLIEETKAKEPASIDLPDKNAKLYYDKKEGKWKLRAYQKQKGKEATHFVFVDLKEGDTKEKLLERTRQAIQKEIAKDNINNVTVDGQKQSVNPKFKWAYEWMQKLREVIAADRRKSRGDVYNLPDAVSLAGSSVEPDNIYASISVFIDNRMALEDVSKIEKDIEKIRLYSDDISYTPTYGVGVTMKSGTIPMPLQEQLEPQQFLDIYIRPYTESLRNRYSNQKTNKDASHEYTRVLKPYPAYIKPVNVRPDFQSVTGASQAFHMVVDITQTEGTGNIASLVFFNPVYYKWRMYKVNDVLSADELNKFSADWEIKRVQLLTYFKERAQINTEPLQNEKAMAQRKVLEATFSNIAESKPMFYGDSGLEPDGNFTLPDVPGDYLVYCSAQTDPFDDTIQIPSEAFLPIRLREGYELAHETLVKYRNPELTKLEKDLSETNDAAKQDQIKQKINTITSTALRDTTDESKPGSKIGDANERIRIAKKLEALFKEWDKDNDKSISNDLEFKLLLSKDEDGKALLELWSLGIKRKSGFVTYNLEKYIEQQNESIKGIQALHSRIEKFDDDIDYTKPIYTPNLILISDETGQEYQLISMLGYEKKSVGGERYGRVVLIDVSTSDTQKIYYSDTFLDKETATEQDFINAAPQAFEDFAGTCKYGEGYIAYEVPALATVHGLLSGECSTGQKFLNVLGKLALVAGIAALVLGTIATGGALGVVAAGLGAASAVIGAALSAKNISDRVTNHRFKFDVEFALDVINIVGPLAMGAGALARASKLGMLDRGIADIAQLSKLQGLVKLEQGIALYQKVEMGTNFILTNYKLLDDLNKINEMNIPEEQKAVLREQLITNGLIGNLMFASSIAHEYSGQPSVDAEINAKIMAVDLTAYKEANIKSGIYTPEGEFNINFAKEHNIPEVAETPAENVNVDEAEPTAAPTATTKSNEATGKTAETATAKTNEIASSHEVPNTATHQNHEHKIAENGAVTRCSEDCSPLSLDMAARARTVKEAFGKGSPNYEKAEALPKEAGKIETRSKRANSLRDKIKQTTEKIALLEEGTKEKANLEKSLLKDKANLKAKEDEIYARSEELERSMAQLESEMVATLTSRSESNVSGLKDLLEKYPDQKKRFEKKLNDFEAKQKEVAAKATDADPETSKAAWDELAEVDKEISEFKKGVEWEIENLARPDISETYVYEEYIASNGDKVKSAKGELGVPGQVQEVRDEASQKAVSKGTGDDAGHLIANIFGGAGDERNLGAQNWQSNEFGTWKELENYWSDKLKSGTKIFVEVKEATKRGENRPYRRVAEWTEVDAAGNITNHDLDFGNFHTPESREAQNIPPTPDVPAEGAEVFIWNAERAKRGLPEYHVEEKQ